MKYVQWFFSLILGLFLIGGVGFAQSTPTLSLQNVEVQPGGTINVNLILTSAPEGLQQYLFALNLSDPNIAVFTSIESVAIPGDLFQLISLSAERIEFRALDLNNDIRPGAQDIILASMTLGGVNEGEASIILEAEAFVDDRGVKIDPQVQNGLVIVGVSNQQPPAVMPAPVLTAPRPLPTAANAPQDLDGDGLFEDVNGDGVFNADDPTLLLNQLNQPSVQEDGAFFDFDGDGQLTPADVNALIDQVVAANPVVEPPVNQTVSVIAVRDLRANVEDVALVDVVLLQAPQGLERYDVRASLSPPGVARVVGVQSVGLGENFIQVISQTDDDIRFRGADLDNRISAGAEQIVLAQLQIEGIIPGLVQVSLDFELFTADGSQPENPNAVSGVIEFFQGPTPLEDGLSAPKDLDGDGLFEDVNGDGVFNEADALLLAFHIDSPNVTNNIQFFDFNGDGQITFADAARLNELIT